MSEKLPPEFIDDHRIEALRQSLNSFLQESFELPESDYYSRLSIQDLIKFKAILANIHNSLTIKLTLEFVTWVSKALSLSAIEIDEIRREVNQTNPNTNGYDIKHDAFVAEVKCNIPVNGGHKYGAAQRAGVIKDIKALLDGKTKAPLVHPTLKFMVFPDLVAVREANEQLRRSTKQFTESFQFLQDNEIPSDPNIVYGVYINLGT